MECRDSIRQLSRSRTEEENLPAWKEKAPRREGTNIAWDDQAEQIQVEQDRQGNPKANSSSEETDCLIVSRPFPKDIYCMSNDYKWVAEKDKCNDNKMHHPSILSKWRVYIVSLRFLSLALGVAIWGAIPLIEQGFIFSPRGLCLWSWSVVILPSSKKTHIVTKTEADGCPTAHKTGSLPLVHIYILLLYTRWKMTKQRLVHSSLPPFWREKPFWSEMMTFLV